MRFQVPQFIEVEDKIFGPLTFKQFIYVGGGVGACALLFMLLPKFLAILLSIPVAVFAAALAFYKMNGKPFIFIVESYIKYLLGNKLYLWKKETKKIDSKQYAVNRDRPLEQVYVPKLSESKLKDLTWSLDINENRNPVTTDDKETGI